MLKKILKNVLFSLIALIAGLGLSNALSLEEVARENARLAINLPEESLANPAFRGEVPFEGKVWGRDMYVTVHAIGDTGWPTAISAVETSFSTDEGKGPSFRFGTLSGEPKRL